MSRDYRASPNAAANAQTTPAKPYDWASATAAAAPVSVVEAVDAVDDPVAEPVALPDVVDEAMAEEAE